MNMKLIVCSVLIGILVNLVVPKLITPYASKDEIKPPNGASKLSLKEQVVHMFVHHAQVPISSSIIIAIIVSISVLVGEQCCKM
jgi:hypothetical protein|tara:strand:+ start:284 stop:535 length:252 start_codon:yes stop_codon:yes gene_type:complete